MKYIFLLSIFLFSLLATSKIYSQSNAIDPVQEYKNGIKDGELFNDKMLNILFSEKVGTSFGGSSDLSLQKYYAALDASENSLAIGVNIDNRGKENTLKKLNWIYSFGAKFKSKEKFATISKNGDFLEDNIGLTLKASWILSGTINFNEENKWVKGQKLILKNRKEAVKAYREKESTLSTQNNILANEKSDVYLFSKYDEKVKKFNKDSVKIIEARLERLSMFDKLNTDLTLQKQLKKKSNKVYEEIAREEIKYLEDNKLYNFVSDKWLSFDVYAPLGNISYKTTDDTSIAFSEQNFYPIEANLSWTYFREYSSGVSAFFTAKTSFKNNNNILTEGLATIPFQTTAIGANEILIVTKSDDVYLTDYKEFLTSLIHFEVAFFIFNNTIGLSPAIERNFGDYDALNWKLGIPFSLKDKEGNPKVNFELLWKEQKTLTSSNHFVGISTNFVFGDLIN